MYSNTYTTAVRSGKGSRLNGGVELDAENWKHDYSSAAMR